MTEELTTGLYAIPKGWVWTELGQITDIILGQSPPSSTYNENQNGLPFYQGKLEFGKISPTPRNWCSKPKKIAEKGDVLISVRAPVGPTNICPDKSCIGRGLAAIRGLNGIEPLFILHLLRTFEHAIARKGTGTTFSAVSGNQLRRFNVPLPPLAEQHRIVNKIEELFSVLDVGVESLLKVRKELKHYRQAVLEYAFNGKLTENWRKAHQDKAESAQELLDGIDERKSKVNGKTKRSIVDISVDAIPEGWVLGSLDQLSELIVDCLHSTPKFTSSGKYCVDTNCIEPNKILFEKSRFVSEETYRDRVRRLVPKVGDVLFAREGTIGTAVVVPKGVELCLGQRMMMFRPEKEVFPQFFMWGLLSPLFARQWKSKITGSTVNHVNIGDLRTMRMPLPNTDEQKIIAEEVDRRFSVVNEIENALKRCLGYADQIQRSILKNAFEGKLVSQDPTDEPAERLFERIRSEKIKRTKSENNKVGTKKLGLMNYVK